MKTYILNPTTGFKLMEHIEVHHSQEVAGHCNARELKALHDKMHLLDQAIEHVHTKKQAASEGETAGQPG